jgi:hypothetical protein
MKKYFILIGQVVFIVIGISACTSRIITGTSALNVSDKDAILISTPSSSDREYAPSTMIRFLDGESIIGWHVKVSPGRHTIDLQNVETSFTKRFFIDTKIGQRYDLTFAGKGWEILRDPSDDRKFLGSSSPLKTTPLIADSSGLFIDAETLREYEVGKQKEKQAKDDALKAWQASPAGQDAIKNAKINAEKLRISDELKRRELLIRNQQLVRSVGQKICKEINGTERRTLGTYNGESLYGPESKRKYHITAFTENIAGEKIQLRIAGIRKEIPSGFSNIDRIEGDTVLQPNSVVWDDPLEWQPCY